MPSLEVNRGRRRLFERSLEADETVIGRSDAVGVALDSPAVSRRHARVLRQGRTWVLENLGGRNGLFVNGRYATVVVLKDGDRIGIADYELVFRAREAAQDELGRILSDRPGDDPAMEEAVRNAASVGGTTAMVSPHELHRMREAADRRRKPHLVVVSDQGARTEVAIEKPTLSIGFDDAHDVRLPGKRRFGKLCAELQTTDRGHRLTRSSRLVTMRLRGESVSALELEDGDIVEIAGVRVRYRSAAD